MNWQAMLGVTATIILFLPVTLVFIFNLHKHRSFIALGIYFFMTGIYNLTQQNMLHTPSTFNYYLGIGTNLLDAPLMLIFLCSFCTSPVMVNRIKYAIYGFIVYEIIIISMWGMNLRSLTAILGLDIAIVLIPTFIFFLRQIKLIVTHHRGMSRTLMISSVLLAYMLYCLVYFFYYVFNTPDKGDTILMYYIASLVSTIIMCLGLVSERSASKKLRN